MRRIAALLALATALAACGSTARVAGAQTPTPIVFGTTGGNLASYSVSIQPTGTVEIRSPVGDHPRRRLTRARVRQLRDEILQAHLRSVRCPGFLPDFAARYIRLGSRTVTVRGGCEPRFNHVWNDLTRAVRFPQ